MDQQRGRRRGRALLQTFATFAAGCFFSFLVVSAPWRSRERRKVGVVFGDSITQHGFVTPDDGPGWVCRLSNHFSRKMDILNRGFSGYTTRDIVAVWPSISLTLPKQLDLVVIFFGANDAILQGAGPQSVPLKDFTLNLQRLISLFPRTKVVLITPPPVSEIDLQGRNRARGKPVLLDRTNENTEKYANAVIELGTITRIPVVDFFHLALPNPKAVLSDGLHLNAPGNDLLFKSLLVELERLGLVI